MQPSAPPNLLKPLCLCLCLFVSCSLFAHRVPSSWNAKTIHPIVITIFLKIMLSQLFHHWVFIFRPSLNVLLTGTQTFAFNMLANKSNMSIFSSFSWLCCLCRTSDPLRAHDVWTSAEMGATETRGQVLSPARRFTDWEQRSRWVSSECLLSV